MPSRKAHVARISGVFSCASKCSPQGQRGGPAAMALGGWVECLLVLSPSSKIGRAKWLFCVAWALKKRHQDLPVVCRFPSRSRCDRSDVGRTGVCVCCACMQSTVFRKSNRRISETKDFYKLSATKGQQATHDGHLQTEGDMLLSCRGA